MLLIKTSFRMKSVVFALATLCLTFWGVQAFPKYQQLAVEESQEFRGVPKVETEPSWEAKAPEVYMHTQSNTHIDEEIAAQAMCSSLQIKSGLGGWTYAVGRTCGNNPSCVSICDSIHLHVQDTQTATRTWQTLGAFHLYMYRPLTGAGGVSTATLGMKSYWSSTLHYDTNCGPNYCCCHAAA